jgi:hypothetical protein
LSDPESDERALLAELRRLVGSGAVRLELDRRKIEHIDFPLAVQADGNRWIYAAAALTALAFWRLGLVAGVAAAIAGFVLYRTLGLRFMARRLDARIRERGLYSVDQWRRLWRFGGVVLTGPDGTPCQGPAQSWMAMVRAITRTAG